MQKNCAAALAAPRGLSLLAGAGGSQGAGLPEKRGLSLLPWPLVSEHQPACFPSLSFTRSDGRLGEIIRAAGWKRARQPGQMLLQVPRWDSGGLRRGTVLEVERSGRTLERAKVGGGARPSGGLDTGEEGTGVKLFPSSWFV